MRINKYGIFRKSTNETRLDLDGKKTKSTIEKRENLALWFLSDVFRDGR